MSHKFVPYLAVLVSGTGVFLQVTLAEPHLRRLDARVLRMEAALLDAQEAMLTAAAANTNSMHHRGSTVSPDEHRQLLLAAARQAAETAAESRAEAFRTEHSPSPLAQAVNGAATHARACVGRFSSWVSAKFSSKPEPLPRPLQSQ